jgi:membrane protein involved in colicin uptake
MSGHKTKTFNDRLKTAGEAKQALLDKFRARPAADDPAVVERQAARQAVSNAREARIAEREAQAAEREAARREKDETEAAEQSAREIAQREQRLREAAEAAEREAALETERKAARDARYAARKSRK